MKITSSGIIRNEDKPRVGVTSANRLASWVFDEIDQGIDLTWEEFLQDLRDSGIEEDSAEWQNEVDRADFDSRVVLFGDWTKDAKGLYVPDENGPSGFAATYNSDSNNVSVEYSKTVVKCHHTSPCYVMANGDGPCGDLDTPGDSVLAYSLPPEFFSNDD